MIGVRSSGAGRGGGGVLEHGRKALRAGGVVGVIAAEGCALEILPKIDVPGEVDTTARGNRDPVMSPAVFSATASM